MGLNDIQQFKQLVQKDAGLQERLRQAMKDHEGLGLGDRELFEAVLVPVAASVGIKLTYEMAQQELLEGRELTDDELEAIVGGAGTVYQKVIGSIIAVTIAFSAVPTTAIAEELVIGSDDDAIVLLDQELGLQDSEDVGSEEAVVLDLEAAEDTAEAEAASDSYVPDFAMEDIALPEGIIATDEGLELTDDASDDIAVFVQASGLALVGNDFAVVDYAPEQLGYVDECSKSVQSLGKGVFEALKGATSGYAKAGVVSVEYLLKLVGALKSNDSVNDELLAQVKSLNTLVQSMSQRLNANIRQTYQNRLTVFDNAVGALNIECSAMETMYKKGHALAKQRGLLKRADANGGVDTVLVNLMREEDKKGNRDFRDFSALMNSVRTNFETVAVECAKEGGASPFYAFDSYWSLYFNFDTQGYFLRQAYRANATLQLKRAYSLLALYYGLPEELDAGTASEPITAALQAALLGIDALPAGTSPEALQPSLNGMATHQYQVPAHCYTTGRDYWRTSFTSYVGSKSSHDYIPEEQMKEFCKRLHGHTVAEDLRLAGLMIEYDPTWNDWCASHGLNYRITPDNYVGLGYQSGGFKSTYIPFNATAFSPVTVPDEDYFMVFLNPVR